MGKFLYFLILTSLWAGVWAGPYWYFRTRHEFRNGKLRPEAKRLRIILWLLVPTTLVLYCLSYAPVLRVIAGGYRLEMLDDLFVPVQWLFDFTPLREPFLRWADLWQVDRDALLRASDYRLRGFWGTTPPAVYAIGWLVLGVICWLLPPFLLERVQTGIRNRRNRQVLSSVAEPR